MHLHYHIYYNLISVVTLDCAGHALVWVYFCRVHADGHFQLAGGNCWESSGGLCLLTVTRIIWGFTCCHRVGFNLRSRLASCGFDVHSVTSPALEFVFVGKEKRATRHDGCSTATSQLNRYVLNK